MTKFVCPLPAPDLDADTAPPPADAAWWRLPFTENADGFLYEVVTDGAADRDDSTFISWEFFNDDDTVVEVGPELTTQARIVERGSRGHVDFLIVAPLSPSPSWRRLTDPGDHVHPEDKTGEWWFAGPGRGWRERERRRA